MNTPMEKVLLGTAIGDSLGLPAEGLSSRQIAQRWPGSWHQRFVGNRGMVSDDTEHSVFVAQSLLGCRGNAAAFQRLLAWKLRLWLLFLPAGVGFATLRAVTKLWLGFPPSRSGIFSAGNGPAMRSAIIGAFHSNNPDTLREFVRLSTRITHTDPRAEIGALAIALTAARCLRNSQPPTASEMAGAWYSAGPSDETWRQIVDQLTRAHMRNDSVRHVANILGLSTGVSGFVYHSVPIALYSWLRHYGDFRASLESVLRCGGDTDTVGAMTGALAALNSPIPEEWSSALRDFPISRSYITNLSLALQASLSGGTAKKPMFCWVAVPFRNLAFLIIVLTHGLRRLFPL